MDFFEINQETKEPAIKKTKKFNAKDEKGKTYEIEMELDTSTIEFKTEITEGILTKKYSNILSFNKLKENKIFNLQDTIGEIYEQLEIYINDSPVHCEIKENKVIIKLTSKAIKSPEITFELKEEKTDTNQLINILIEKINNLESKNSSTESEIKNLKLKNNALETKVTNLLSKNNNLEAKISSINSENISLKKEIEYLKNKTDIINEFIDYLKVKEWGA